MKVVYKYPLQVLDDQVIRMPLDAQICSIQVQNNIPTLWAVVDDNLAEINFNIITIGTGQYFKPDGLIYLGTYQLVGFVGHVFLSKEP